MKKFILVFNNDYSYLNSLLNDGWKIIYKYDYNKINISYQEELTNREEVFNKISYIILEK